MQMQVSVRCKRAGIGAEMHAGVADRHGHIVDEDTSGTQCAHARRSGRVVSGSARLLVARTDRAKETRRAKLTHV